MVVSWLGFRSARGGIGRVGVSGCRNPVAVGPCCEGLGGFFFCAWILSPLVSKFLYGAARVVSLGQGFCGRGNLECWDCTTWLVRPL